MIWTFLSYGTARTHGAQLKEILLYLFCIQLLSLLPLPSPYRWRCVLSSQSHSNMQEDLPTAGISGCPSQKGHVSYSL